MWGTRPGQARAVDHCRFIPTHVGNTWVTRTADARDAVHPHACGEHQEVQLKDWRFDGSSPRMWGTPGSPAQRLALRRFIPTHVGNTSKRFGRKTSATVHPHACGEHLWCLTARTLERGSSPRMWGTLPIVRAAVLVERFIPTHVGNTAAAWAPAPPSTVHPHACGEHSTWRPPAAATPGSSPRMWGTHGFSRHSS